MTRELLFKVTKADFDETHIRGSGPGGQHRNKTSTGVRLVHRDSGAVGQATDSKSQSANRKAAFRRLRETQEWKLWFRERVRVAHGVPSAEERLAESMKPENFTTQVRDGKRWVTVDESELTDG